MATTIDEAGGELATEYLEAQHREVEDLFEALENANDSAETMDLFETLADKLTIHARIEERFFYPAVRGRKTEDAVMEAFVEHTEIKRLLAELMTLDPDDEVWGRRMADLKDHVDHHVEEEENDLFLAAEHLLTRDELLALTEEMDTLARELEGTDPRRQLQNELGEQPTLG